MSQKTNPTSCRLQKTNKHFSSCWYSDLFYTQTSTHDLQVRSYIEQVSEQIGHSQVFSYIVNSFRRSHAYLFFLDTRVIRHGREKALRLRSNFSQKRRRVGQGIDTSGAFLLSYLSFYNRLASLAPAPSPYGEGAGEGVGWHSGAVLGAYNGVAGARRKLNLHSCTKASTGANANNLVNIKNTVDSKDFKQTSYVLKVHACTALLQERLERPVQGLPRSPAPYGEGAGAGAENMTLSSQQTVAQRRSAPSTLNPTLFRNSVERTLDSHSSNHFTVYPIRVMQDIQSAGFLAQEVASILRRGAPFKQVQDKVLNECTGKKNGLVKGIRLSCSGRVGGRSKKAQKAKTQSVQWGETSLHVFSSRLSFASTSANTPFGKIGIKVWLCFAS